MFLQFGFYPERSKQSVGRLFCAISRQTGPVAIVQPFAYAITGSHKEIEKRDPNGVEHHSPASIAGLTEHTKKKCSLKGSHIPGKNAGRCGTPSGCGMVFDNVLGPGVAPQAMMYLPFRQTKPNCEPAGSGYRATRSA